MMRSLKRCFLKMAVNKSNEDQRMPARMTMPYMFFVQEAPPVENGLDGDKGDLVSIGWVVPALPAIVAS